MLDPRAAPAPGRLRIDDRVPADERADRSRTVDVAIDPRPRLSWTVPLVRNGQAQTAYEIRLAPPGVDLRTAAETELTWSSGVVESAESTWLRPGSALAPNGSWVWTVRTRDETGTWSGWAEPATIETGPFHAGDWDASWLSAPPTSTVTGSAQLPAVPVRARLHVAGQGMYRAVVAGTVVNPGTAEPSRTDSVRALSRTYDVTDLLGPGHNELAFVVAAGHWAASGLEPRIIAELVCALPDGSIVRTGTGPGWRTRTSRVVAEEAFYVEKHDGRHDDGADLGTPTVVGPAVAPMLPARIEPDPAPPVRVVGARVAREVRRSADGSRVFDVGQNIAGRTRLTLNTSVPSGTVVTLVHGELTGPDGGVDTTNLKMPYDTDRYRQSVEYTTAGRAGEQVEAWFAFHGFRYVEVIGLPDDADVELTALVLHSDLPLRATLATDDPVIDTLLAAAARTQLNNVHGIPEDCPTREQAGWTGDAAATTELMLAQFDVAGFYRKWLGDLATSQQADGGLPAVVPSLRPEATPPDPVWGSALQRALLGHWRHYGDRSLVADQLPTLRRWADYQLGLVHDGVVGRAPISYGHDWLALEQTPPELLHTCATLDALDSLAELERAAGDDGEADRREWQAAELRRTARTVFHDAIRDVWANGSQASLALAVDAGLAGDDETPKLGERLADAVHARGNRVSTGFAATPALVRALSATGRVQAISDAIRQPEQPGVGAMLVDGPGTLWESWWIDPLNTGTGSLDHVGLGGPFGGWVWTGLVGLRPTGPGFGHFTVSPAPVAEVRQASSTTETVRGTVRAAWRRDNDRIVVDVEVPVGSTATVTAPGVDGIIVGSGWHRLEGRWPEPAAVPPPAWPAFHPPARAPVAADVHGGARWHPGGTDATLTTGSAVASVDVLPDGIVCMPVHHAQLPGPVARAIGRAGAYAGAEHLLRLDFMLPADLSAATFAYALIDLCLPNPKGEHAELVVRLHGRDGTERTGRARPWPAGWNRVTVDLADWPTHEPVTAAEAGLRFLDQPEAPGSPVSFHLGEIGWSAANRTW